jgi:acyl-CoA synthetase (AMP-forming)/AMP-acid ligase II
MPNTAEWLIVLLGAMEAELLVSTANPQYTAGKYTDTARSTVGSYAHFVKRTDSWGIGNTVCSVASRERSFTN